MLKTLPIGQFMNKKHNFVVSLSKGFPLPSIGFLFPVRRSDTLSTPRAETLFSLTLQQRAGGFLIAFFACSCAALCFGMFFFPYVEFRCYCGNDNEAYVVVLRYFICIFLFFFFLFSFFGGFVSISDVLISRQR
jgi:hypothetical protein